jgi:hypothetical protein
MKMTANETRRSVDRAAKNSEFANFLRPSDLKSFDSMYASAEKRNDMETSISAISCQG